MTGAETLWVPCSLLGRRTGKRSLRSHFIVDVEETLVHFHETTGKISGCINPEERKFKTDDSKS